MIDLKFCLAASLGVTELLTKVIQALIIEKEDLNPECNEDFIQKSAHVFSMGLAALKDGIGCVEIKSGEKDVGKDDFCKFWELN